MQKSSKQGNLFFQIRKLQKQVARTQIFKGKTTINGKNWGSVSDWVSVAVATVGMGMTIALFFQTQRATTASINSANAATEANKHAREKDSVDRIAQIKNDSIAQHRFEEAQSQNRKSVDSTIEMSKKSLNQQIAQLKELRRQYENDHRTIVTIENVQVRSFNEDRNSSFVLDVKAFGAQPIRIDSSSTGVALLDSITGTTKEMIHRNISATDFNWTNQSFYVSAAQPLKELASFFKPFRKELYNEARQGKRMMFVYGQLNYTNLATNKKGAYKFYILVRPKAVNMAFDDSYEYFYNENIFSSER